MATPHRAETLTSYSTPPAAQVQPQAAAAAPSSQVPVTAAEPTHVNAVEPTTQNNEVPTQEAPATVAPTHNAVSFLLSLLRSLFQRFRFHANTMKLSLVG
jgi:hypothetical protein